MEPFREGVETSRNAVNGGEVNINAGLDQLCADESTGLTVPQTTADYV